MLQQSTMGVLCGTVTEHTIVEYAGIQFHRKRRRDGDREAVHQYQCTAGSARHDGAGEHGNLVAAVFGQQTQWVGGRGAATERLSQKLLFSLESLIVEPSPAPDAVNQRSAGQ